MTQVPDPIKQGLQRGWKTINASTLDQDLTIDTDIVIIGTGAGGGTSAEILSNAGFKVVMVEEGPLKSSSEFNLNEREAYRDLYQEGAARATLDGEFTILQGRSVGGSTTVNWTSSFRTPDQTLSHWQDQHNVAGMSKGELAPWFKYMEKRLNITPWAIPPNKNNSVLSDGCEKLNYKWKTIPRNVTGCWNLGYCGMGCPVNAKQSMLVTTIPAALDNKAQLIHRARAHQLTIEGDKVTGVVCHALNADGLSASGKTITIQAKHTISACGGINGPGLLMRSEVPDPHNTLGKRTFLHPVTGSFAEFKDNIDPYYGAPQSIYSDHFVWEDGTAGKVGYKLEIMPLHPGLAAALMGGEGEEQFRRIKTLPKLNGMIALMRDGFHEDSPGGTVQLRSDGSPVVDYKVNEYLLDGARRSHLSMIEIQFAAGAKKVRPSHAYAVDYMNWKEARTAVNNLHYSSPDVRLGCAHVMGGCAMGEDPRTSVTNSQGAFHHLSGLSVLDGSLFPTSIGANPQLSIYGIVAKLATELATELKKG